MKKIKKLFGLISWLLTVTAVVCCTGCVVVAVGAGAAAGAATYAYVSGELRSIEQAELQRAVRAGTGAVEALQFKLVSTRSDALYGEINAVTAANKKVVIRLKRIGDNATEVRIRVGTFGDRAISVAILERLRQRL